MTRLHLIGVRLCALAFASLLLAGCPGGDGCKPVPHAGTYCQDGEVYWVDSCGGIEQFRESCGCGCSADHLGCLTPCACVPNCLNRCCGDNGCGQPCRDHCGDTGQTCDFGNCTCSGACLPQTCAAAGYACGYWPGADGCGGDLQCPTCPNGQTCNAGGQCEGATCQGGLTDCGGTCVDTDSDEAHCGGCNKPCTASETCQNGVCESGPDCEGISLSSDGVLNLDIGAVTVSGQVTLEGAVLPNVPQGRGQLQFTQLASGSAVTVDLETTGPKTYQLSLAPGHYRVDYLGNPAMCAEDDAPLPCNWGTLQADLNLQSDGVLNLDIPVVHIGGRVTLKGQVLPTESVILDRGRLLFTLRDGGEAFSKPFQVSGDYSYSLSLFPGTYTVRLDANEGLCRPGHQTEIPCIDGVLMANLGLANDGVLNVDIPAVKIQGQVTLEGLGLPNEGLGRGQLGFVSATTGSAKYLDLETSGAFAYAVTLLPGSYAIDYVGNPALCNAPMAALPCNQGRLYNDLSLQSDGVLNVDIPAVRVQGQVTLEGQPLPTESADRGSLIFALADGGEAASKPFGLSGGFAYDLTILPGNYTLRLDGNEGLCQLPNPPQMPCNDGVLFANLNLQADGVLNADIPAVHVSGTVYLMGNNLPTENLDRGTLIFVLGESGAAARPFQSSGMVQYQMTLLPGAYDVRLDANEALCAQPNPPQMPCNDGPIMRAVNLQSDGVLNVDMGVVAVQGQVTLEGQGLPSENQDRGAVVFALRDGGAVSSKSFQSSGGFSYQLRLLPGRYLVTHQANPGLCGTATPLPNFPCNDQILLGCD